MEGWPDNPSVSALIGYWWQAVGRSRGSAQWGSACQRVGTDRSALTGRHRQVDTDRSAPTGRHRRVGTDGSAPTGRQQRVGTDR